MGYRGDLLDFVIARSNLQLSNSIVIINRELGRSTNNSSISKKKTDEYFEHMWDTSCMSKHAG